MAPRDDPPPSIIWDAQGQPRSTLYGDVYFSTDDGLEEARSVYLRGCGLPEAWADRDRFCVGELGFGAGLTIAALLDLWRATRPARGHLNIFSVEAHDRKCRRVLGEPPADAVQAGLPESEWARFGAGRQSSPFVDSCNKGVAVQPTHPSLTLAFLGFE